MEAHGVHTACRDATVPPVPLLCVKSICDFARNKKDRWRKYAAFTSAQFCYRFVVAEWHNLRPAMSVQTEVVAAGTFDANRDRVFADFLAVVRRQFPERTASEIGRIALAQADVGSFIAALGEVSPRTRDRLVRDLEPLWTEVRAVVAKGTEES
jgi:hypothetical protein